MADREGILNPERPATTVLCRPESKWQHREDKLNIAITALCRLNQNGNTGENMLNAEVFNYIVDSGSRPRALLPLSMLVPGDQCHHRDPVDHSTLGPHPLTVFVRDWVPPVCVPDQPDHYDSFRFTFLRDIQHSSLLHTRVRVCSPF